MKQQSPPPHTQNRIFSFLMTCTSWIILMSSLPIHHHNVVNAADDYSSTNTLKYSLSQGDKALIDNDVQKAIQFYEEGIQTLTSLYIASTVESDLDSDLESDSADEHGSFLPNPEMLVEAISIHANLGTAYSMLAEESIDLSSSSSSSSPQNRILYQRKAIQTYREGLHLHQQHVDKNDKKYKEANDIAAQTAFFLGMTFQDEFQFEPAMNSYGLAFTLDPYHWSALANMGALIMDYDDFVSAAASSKQQKHQQQNLSPMMRLYQNPAKRNEEALMAYTNAYELLINPNVQATDTPENPEFMISQLQYRIGMILSSAQDDSRVCVRMSDHHSNSSGNTKQKQQQQQQDDDDDDEGEQVDCRQMAAHAFSLAVEYDPSNEPAKHMLAATTADATVKRASNTYVAELFEKYARNFEHSLVDELGYTGYERLRRGFDRAFGGSENVPTFSLVVDAGCGTGLVGEQFRNVSQYLIGADLSPTIIEEAQKLRPNLYDDTFVGDVTEFFASFSSRKPSQLISLIIAADSYIYFGDLMPLFESMAMGLKKNGEGIVAFTLENVGFENEMSLKEMTPNWRWQITPSGRFAHRKEYVEHVADVNNLEVMHYERMDGFRYEKGIPVRGHLFVMRTKSNTAKTEL